MSIEEKISVINSKRKESKGFNEEVFRASNVKVIEKIRANKSIARLNPSNIYSDYHYLSSSVRPYNFNFSETSEFKVNI
ncbi:MAG: hypothetical protein JXQ96_10725 [Cyclobacteriaceae bacterium]